MADSSLQFIRRNKSSPISFLLSITLVMTTSVTAGTISNCNSGRCEFCTRGSLDCDPYFYSNCADKQFVVSFNATCQTKLCIYLISCKSCHMKYVGKTKNVIRSRFNYHRGHMRKGTEAKLMLDHCTANYGCNISDMII